MSNILKEKLCIYVIILLNRIIQTNNKLNESEMSFFMLKNNHFFQKSFLS